MSSLQVLILAGMLEHWNQIIQPCEIKGKGIFVEFFVQLGRHAVEVVLHQYLSLLARPLTVSLKHLASTTMALSFANTKQFLILFILCKRQRYILTIKIGLFKI